MKTNSYKNLRVVVDVYDDATGKFEEKTILAVEGNVKLEFHESTDVEPVYAYDYNKYAPRVFVKRPTTRFELRGSYLTPREHW